MTSITIIRTLCLLTLATLFSNATHAFNTIDVHVTINSSSTFSGDWDELWNRPDQFVAIYDDAAGAGAPWCQSYTVIDRMYVGPPAPADWRCDFNAERPGRLYIALYDGDGPGSDNTQSQQIDVASGPAKAAVVNLETLVLDPGASYTFSRSGDSGHDQGTINFTVTAHINPGELISFTSTRAAFRPSAGEQIVVTGTATGAPYTHLRVNAFNSAGANVWSIFGDLDAPGQMSKTFVWQGRDHYGNPLPPGLYTLKLQGSELNSDLQAIGPLNGNGIWAVGGMLVQTIEIQPPPALPTLRVLGTVPSQQWAPDVGDLAINVVSSGTTHVTGEVFVGTACGGTRLMTLPPVTVSPLFPGVLTWAGPVFTGGAVPLGQYRIKVSGTSNGGPTSPAFICQPIEMIAAAPARVYTQHTPFLPAPGQVVNLTARAVDATGAPRIVGRLDVLGTVQSLPGAPPPAPTAPLRSCTMASSCTATIRLPVGDSFMSWRATAADRATTIADSGWRGQGVTSPGGFAQSTNYVMPTDVALTGPFMTDERSKPNSQDIVFSVSTEFDWNSEIDRQSIGNALDRFMTRLWGVEGPRASAPTTFLSRPDLVRVYLSPEQHPVSMDPTNNLCEWTVPFVPWADARAILHNTNCRDNAYTSSRSFSARLLAQDVIMHELHHALFGLADEYPSGDGGYFEASPFPNVYHNVADCEAQVGREPGGCQGIDEIDIVTRMATGRRFFRLDLSAPDVMIGGGTQRFGDVRRANWMEGVCDAGGC